MSNLPAAAETWLLRRLRDGSFDAWADTAATVGYCARPVRLTGHSTTIDTATGEVLGSYSSTDAPLGVLFRACGNRRADVCPACSRVYARHLRDDPRRPGRQKDRPRSRGRQPLLFVTLTAPSFGHVHGPRSRAGQSTGGRCRPRDRATSCTHGRPVGCMAVHGPDPANGSALCPDCYDWTSAVIWQWWAPELWRRTTIALNHSWAKASFETTDNVLSKVSG